MTFAIVGSEVEERGSQPLRRNVRDRVVGSYSRVGRMVRTERRMLLDRRWWTTEERVQEVRRQVDEGHRMGPVIRVKRGRTSSTRVWVSENHFDRQGHHHHPLVASMTAAEEVPLHSTPADMQGGAPLTAGNPDLDPRLFGLPHPEPPPPPTPPPPIPGLLPFTPFPGIGGPKTPLYL